MPTLTVTPNVTDVRQLDDAESTCRGLGAGVTVRWNTSELDPDVEFDVRCVDNMAACRLRLRGPLSRARVHCIAANDVGNKVHAWTLYTSGPGKSAKLPLIHRFLVAPLARATQVVTFLSGTNKRLCYGRGTARRACR